MNTKKIESLQARKTKTIVQIQQQSKLLTNFTQYFDTIVIVVALSSLLLYSQKVDLLGYVVVLIPIAFYLVLPFCIGRTCKRLESIQEEIEIETTLHECGVSRI